MKQFFKNLGAVLFGVAICMIALVSSECIFRKMARSSSPVLSYWPDKEYKDKDPSGIIKAMPGEWNFRKEIGKNVIYDVNYTIDRQGRRTAKTTGEKNKYAIFFGCSFVFGEGVNDEETIPFIFAKDTEYAAYNFGFSGDGPFDVLAKAESYPFSAGQKYSEGVIFYIFNDAHLYRVKGDLHEIAWQWERPYYEDQAGILMRKGSFLSGRHIITKALLLLRKSELLRTLGISRIIKINDHDLILAKKAVLRIWEELDIQLPGAKKYLVIYPGSGPNVQKFKHIIEDTVDVIDLSSLFELEGEYQIEGDGHPSKLANEVFVRELKSSLNALKSAQ